MIDNCVPLRVLQQEATQDDLMNSTDTIRLCLLKGFLKKKFDLSLVLYRLLSSLISVVVPSSFFRELLIRRQSSVGILDEDRSTVGFNFWRGFF